MLAFPNPNEKMFVYISYIAVIVELYTVAAAYIFLESSTGHSIT